MSTKLPPVASPISFILGLLFTSAGIVLGSVILIIVLDGSLHRQVATRIDFLIVTITPQLEVLSATQTPSPTPTITATPTSTPTPTATPVPPPPIRIKIPYIGVNAKITLLEATQSTTWQGDTRWVWADPGYAVGQLDNGNNLGGGSNIVLSGHNNWMGEVFRDLYLLKPGNEIILYSTDKEFHYTIEEVTIVPYRRDPQAGEATIQNYAAPTAGEQVTLISCYPYITNADRIVVIAKPILNPDSSS